MYIYIIVNLNNNKIYVGQTRQPLNLRYNQHISYLRKGNHYNAHLQRAWNNSNPFMFSEIEKVNDINRLNEQEVYWIKFFDSMNPNKGYNKESGGRFNKEMSQETKEKLRQRMLGNKYTLGYKPTAESIAKGAAKRRGRKTGPRPDEVKAKIAAKLSGNKSLHWGKLGVNSRKVLCLNNNQEFVSATHAARALGCDRSTICAICRGEVKQTKGFRFKYLD